MPIANLTQTDNRTFLAPEDFFGAFTHQFHSIDIEGRSMQLRGATGLEIFQLICRFPKFRALISDTAEMFFADETSAEKAQSRVNIRTITDVAMDIGVDATVAFVACCSNRPGDLKFEKMLLTQVHDSVLAAALIKAIEITLGGRSPTDFFIEKISLFEKLGIRMTPKKKLPKAANRLAKKTSNSAA